MVSGQAECCHLKRSYYFQRPKENIKKSSICQRKHVQAFPKDSFLLIFDLTSCDSSASSQSLLHLDLALPTVRSCRLGVSLLVLDLVTSDVPLSLQSPARSEPSLLALNLVNSDSLMLLRSFGRCKTQDVFTDEKMFSSKGQKCFFFHGFLVNFMNCI